LSEKDGGEHSLQADFEINAGDTVYAVYAVYSTADSFSESEGEYLELISAHKNVEVAQRNLARINDRASKKLMIEFDGGGFIERYRPWDGYFESLDYADIYSATV
jgi:hypothetical protein